MTARNEVRWTVGGVACAETPLAIALAKELPEGTILGTGKGQMPLVKGKLCDKLSRVLTPWNVLFTANPRQ
jgi:hypothetical protein